MFVNIVQFPAVASGKDGEFREWFAWSTGEFRKHKGFIARRLLKPRDGGNYVAIVEHESFETFRAMHESATQAEARQRVDQLLDGSPIPQFYEVVVD